MVPTSVWATAGVSAMMVVSSALIMVQNVGLLPDVLYHDCLVTQNLGHAAFLLGFATSAALAEVGNEIGDDIGAAAVFVSALFGRVKSTLYLAESSS